MSKRKKKQKKKKSSKKEPDVIVHVHVHNTSPTPYQTDDGSSYGELTWAEKVYLGRDDELPEGGPCGRW